MVVAVVVDVSAIAAAAVVMLVACAAIHLGPSLWVPLPQLVISATHSVDEVAGSVTAAVPVPHAKMTGWQIVVVVSSWLPSVLARVSTVVVLVVPGPHDITSTEIFTGRGLTGAGVQHS